MIKPKTLLISFAATTLLLAGSAIAETPGSYYSDVPQHHWAATAVNTLSGEGILLGNPDGTFGGTTLLSRYELSMILHRFYTHQIQRDATPVDDLVSQVDELTQQVEYLTQQNQDLFSLLEQVMATHNVEASAQNSRIKHLEGVTEVLQTLSTTVVAGPPGPAGPPGQTIYLDANGNPIEAPRAPVQVIAPEGEGFEETSTAESPVAATPVAENPTQSESPHQENQTAATQNQVSELADLSTIELLMILNSRADREQLMDQLNTTDVQYALY